ncbi:MAG: hypothetical protein JSR82_01270 [Verrucomicrobia bacterium]|nr:hypothetical protein [Verrucomicrobiota bacterium]
MLARIFLLLLLAGAALLFFGITNLRIEGGASKEPTTVSVSDFEKKVPDNRHVIITGAMADLANTIKLTTTRKRSGSSTVTYFVPLWNPAGGVVGGKKRGVAVVKMGSADFEAQRAKGLNFTSVQGMRVTDLDFNSKAKDEMAKEYGKEVVDKMPIISWNQKPAGTGLGYGLVFGGVVCLGLGGYAFLRGRQQDAQAAAAPPAAPAA